MRVEKPNHESRMLMSENRIGALRLWKYRTRVWCCLRAAGWSGSGADVESHRESALK